MSLIPIPNFSDIRKMISQYKNAELNHVILDLQAGMLEILEENRSLKEENETLKKKTELTQKMSFKAPFWYVEGDEQPYCPNCKESKDVFVHLVGGAEEFTCPACYNRYKPCSDGGWRVIPRST